MAQLLVTNVLLARIILVPKHVIGRPDQQVLGKEGHILGRIEGTLGRRTGLVHIEGVVLRSAQIHRFMESQNDKKRKCPDGLVLFTSAASFRRSALLFGRWGFVVLHFQNRRGFC